MNFNFLVDLCTCTYLQLLYSSPRPRCSNHRTNRTLCRSGCTPTYRTRGAICQEKQCNPRCHLALKTRSLYWKNNVRNYNVIYPYICCLLSKRDIVGSIPGMGKNVSFCNSGFLRVAHKSNQPIQMKSTVTYTKQMPCFCWRIVCFCWLSYNSF